MTAPPAVDNRNRAFRARGETDRGAGVAMRPGALTGVKHGEGSEQRARRGRFRSERRMRHDQRATFDVVDRYLCDRTVKHRFDVTPAPEERRVRRLRLHRRDPLVTIPEGMQVLCFKLGY